MPETPIKTRVSKIDTAVDLLSEMPRPKNKKKIKKVPENGAAAGRESLRRTDGDEIRAQTISCTRNTIILSYKIVNTADETS